jgi:hypothetical protein
MRRDIKTIVGMGSPRNTNRYVPKGKKCLIFQNVTTTGSSKVVVLSKVNRPATANPIASSTEENRSLAQTTERETCSLAGSKRKLENAHDVCKYTAKKRVPSPLAYTSTAFQRLPTKPAGKPWHARDLHTINQGIKTPSHEVSLPAEPKREMSPAVAQLATFPQTGLAAIKMSNF